MSKWKCPNKEKVPDHQDVILFVDEEPPRFAHEVPYLQVPKPQYCEVCNRYYTRAECIEVKA